MSIPRGHCLRNDLALRLAAASAQPPRDYLFVSTHDQRMTVVAGGEIAAEYSVSTSRFGTGNRQGSNQTPQGVHRIARKIGEGVPPGRIFRSRVDTGLTWAPGMDQENLILSRIMWLEGLEDGVNRGPGIDSHDRYIYIHGTNREDAVGVQPVSHGCVCMRNSDVIDLFDRVKEGTLVIID